MDRTALRRIFDGREVALAREIIDQFLVEIPAFRHVPRELLDGPIVSVSEACVRFVPVLLAEGRTPTDEEMEPFAASAAQRARDGVPLDLIIRGYQVGVRRCWEETLAAVTFDDPDDIRVITDVFFGLLREVNAVVATAHTDERAALLGQQQADRARLLDAVLAGDAKPGPDDGTGLRVPARVVALVLALGPGGEVGQGPGAALAARLLLRRLHVAVHHHIGEPVLGTVDRDGGFLLVPADGTAVPEDPGAARRSLDRLTADIAGATGVPTTAASVPAPLDEAGAAVRLATEVLDVVRRFERPAGHYVLDDLLVEYQWTRPTAATARMAALLEPLREKPALSDTLEAFVGHGCNRRRTAAALHVHPNTVDYRLRRIEALVGVDLREPGDVHRLVAALAARRAVDPPGAELGV